MSAPPASTSPAVPVPKPWTKKPDAQLAPPHQLSEHLRDERSESQQFRAITRSLRRALCSHNGYYSGSAVHRGREAFLGMLAVAASLKGDQLVEIWEDAMSHPRFASQLYKQFVDSFTEKLEAAINETVDAINHAWASPTGKTSGSLSESRRESRVKIHHVISIEAFYLPTIDAILAGQRFGEEEKRFLRMFVGEIEYLNEKIVEHSDTLWPGSVGRILNIYNESLPLMCSYLGYKKLCAARQRVNADVEFRRQANQLHVNTHHVDGIVDLIKCAIDEIIGLNVSMRLTPHVLDPAATHPPALTGTNKESSGEPMDTSEGPELSGKAPAGQGRDERSES